MTTAPPSESTMAVLSSKWFHLTDSPDGTRMTREPEDPSTEAQPTTARGSSEVRYRYPIFVPDVFKRTMLNKLHLESQPSASTTNEATEKDVRGTGTSPGTEPTESRVMSHRTRDESNTTLETTSDSETESTTTMMTKETDETTTLMSKESDETTTIIRKETDEITTTTIPEETDEITTMMSKGTDETTSMVLKETEMAETMMPREDEEASTTMPRETEEISTILNRETEISTTMLRETTTQTDTHEGEDVEHVDLSSKSPLYSMAKENDTIVDGPMVEEMLNDYPMDTHVVPINETTGEDETTTNITGTSAPMAPVYIEHKEDMESDTHMPPKDISVITSISEMPEDTEPTTLTTTAVSFTNNTATSDVVELEPLKDSVSGSVNTMAVPSDDAETETIPSTTASEEMMLSTTASSEYMETISTTSTTHDMSLTTAGHTDDHASIVEITTQMTTESTSQTSSPRRTSESASTTEATEYQTSAMPLSSETLTEDMDSRYISGTNRDLVAAVQFLHYHDKESSDQCFKLVTAHWNYATNITEENKKKQLAQTLEYSMFYKEAWKNATSFAWKSFNDTVLRRWFKSLSVLGTAALSESKLNEFNRIKAEMKAIYSTAKVCRYGMTELEAEPRDSARKGCNLSLEPDLQRILTRSRDYDELTQVWKGWRDAAGKPIRQKYLRFVELSNEAAVLNGFKDTGDMWLESYESKTFTKDLNDLWEQLRPLYEHLHAYVRRKLIQRYGEDRIKADGPIPAHLFGNMWSQSWVSIMDLVQPFSGKPSVDVTSTMQARNMTALEMFKISEEFFMSLGLKAMPEEFWKHSLIEKPKDREILCHASAWDFCNGKDYRIKQCTDITMEDLVTVHHEMGHVQYFLQYARQPNVFREGANPGFHEAIGDVLALSVSTPTHLQSIGLLDQVAEDPEGDLNFLMRAALEKVAFLPSGYLIDLWRWGLFSGDISADEMNTKWWELRLKYQGICPPVKRTEEDFDPGAKYHIPGNVPYIRYFVSFVIQFQFHKVLCDAAGHTGPLYKCDIYRSKEAGQILSQVMELGSSEHWSEAMKIMTGGATNKMDVRPILEYFEPLLMFLKEQNQNETLGWNSLDPTTCP